MKLPKAIENCPIIEAVLEIRFKSSIYPSAVFGIVYKALESEFPNVQKLPILQLPEELIETDPNFKFKPHYKAIGEDFTIQIGPNVFSIISNMPYVGWTIFKDKIIDCLKKIFELEIIDIVNRVGLRYINFFEGNIFENINVEVNINNEKQILKNTVFKTQVENDDLKSTLQIANNAKQAGPNGEIFGSVIDIDTFKEYTDNHLIQNFEKEIIEAHKHEKMLFFSLLKEEFLQKLNPVY